RENPLRQKDVVRIGCGAGFAGDRPRAALKLLHRVPSLQYLVLECLAERTFVERVEAKAAGGQGYDPRISEWMTSLLPVAVEKGVCIVTNMGGVDPLGAQDEVLKLSSKLGIHISVAVAYEYPLPSDGSSTYLGAAPIVQVLQQCRPHVIITSRVADVALFLGPMIFELGWNWNSYKELAQGAVAAHLLECGCQLTGGYYVHPGCDKLRSLPFPELLDVSLPYADISWDGKVVVAKAEGSGGEISERTCSEQLIYEVDDPSSYITPDVILDLRKVNFRELSKDKVIVSGAEAHCSPSLLLRLIPSFCGWKGWGEISYGGLYCDERANLSDKLVRSWLEESFPGIQQRILSCVIGKDSLFASPSPPVVCHEARLRVDGSFGTEEEAAALVREFGALYTNGPAGGGGIRSGIKREITLKKKLVSRDAVSWKTAFSGTQRRLECCQSNSVVCMDVLPTPSPSAKTAPAPRGVGIPLYHIAHSRTGDKGNTLNFSLIPHCTDDIARLQEVVTAKWVKNVFATAFVGQAGEAEVSVYLVEGIHSLNVVVRNVLDGGVTCSRRIDRHGKTLSDLILSQQVTFW
ncbi:hypothetical protein SELMODRAFT_109756, partial [Selaginella moellendorffii]